mmetsp:Transcript_19436/g.27475  ORF Transcript_19436/g.27475 Transcript_19436/m.27475 type:complete len:290 (+) Transcript_19436:147-1016(+)
MISSPNSQRQSHGGDDDFNMERAEQLIHKLAAEANRQKSVPPSIDGYSGGSGSISYQSYHSPGPSFRTPSTPPPTATTTGGSGTKKIFITNHCEDNFSTYDDDMPPMTVSVTTESSSSSSIGNSPLMVEERKRQQQQQLDALDSYQRAYTMAERSMTENSLDESSLQAHVAEQTARRMQEEVIGYYVDGDNSPDNHTINSQHQYNEQQESLASTCVRTMWQCLQGGVRGNGSVTVPTDYFSASQNHYASHKKTGGLGHYVPAYGSAEEHNNEKSGLLQSPPPPSGITRL